MSGLNFLQGKHKEETWSFDRGSTARQCCKEKQQAINIQQVLHHSSSFHLCLSLSVCVCERGDK